MADVRSGSKWSRADVSPETIGQMKDSYDLGLGIREIAEHYGMSYTFARSLLVEAGVKFRERGGYAGRVRRGYSDFAV